MRAVAGRSAVLLAAGALLAVATQAASGFNSRDFVLQRRDLPSGFAVDRKVSGVADNKRAAGGDARLLRDFERWGRVTGYQAEFRRKPARTGALRGVGVVTSRAGLYRTVQGAAASFAAGAKNCSSGGFHVVTLGVSPGTESVSCTAVKSFHGHRFELVAVLWRSRTVKASLIVVGLPGRVVARDVIRLVEAQDGRIAHALTAG